MKVSIITVCFNSVKTLEKTIKSVLEQTHHDIEYLVIDGGSNDGTQELIKQYENSIDYWVSEKDRGIYDALNKGIEKASGEIVGCLHADDVFADSNCVEELVKKMTEENADCCYADLQYVEGDKITRHWQAGTFSVQKYKRGWMPPHPTFYVRRKILDCYKEPAYRLDFASAGDYEFMLRFLVKHQIRSVYLERVLVKMEVGGMSNVSLKNRLRANRMDRKAWAVNGLRPSPFFRLFKPLRKLTQWM